MSRELFISAPSPALQPRCGGDAVLQVQPAMRRCLRVIRSWTHPPNWSDADWAEEATQVANVAALQALRDHCPPLGVSLEAFVYNHARAAAFARYRQEWSYSSRATARADSADGQAGRAGVAETPDYRDLHAAIAALPQPQQFLIQQLFWEELPESSLAASLHLGQTGVSKRKQAALELLRRALMR